MTLNKLFILCNCARMTHPDMYVLILKRFKDSNPFLGNM